MRQIISFNNKNVILPEPWALKAPAPNEIWYKTTDEQIYTNIRTSSLPTIISNTYTNGLGIITFAENLINIGSQAFAEAKVGQNLVSMELPDGVLNVGTQYYYGPWQAGGLSNFIELILPTSVTYLGNYLTANGTALSTITYLGTKSEWNNISKSGSWRSYTNITSVVCTDGTIYY